MTRVSIASRMMGSCSPKMEPFKLLASFASSSAKKSDSENATGTKIDLHRSLPLVFANSTFVDFLPLPKIPLGICASKQYSFLLIVPAAS
jgi:hypothetical protein